VAVKLNKDKHIFIWIFRWFILRNRSSMANL